MVKFMSMTLDEMKLAVCEKLPELIEVCGSVIAWHDHIFNGRVIYWPTEGLQVCHEAEKLLNKNQKCQYKAMLWAMTGHGFHREYENAISATYEKRLETLCRVWWPEKFGKGERN